MSLGTLLVSQGYAVRDCFALIAKEYVRGFDTKGGPPSALVEDAREALRVLNLSFRKYSSTFVSWNVL